MAGILENPAIRSAVMPVSVDLYRNLIDSGLIAENTELLDGVIVEKMTKSPQHSRAGRRLFAALSPVVPPDYALLKEDPLTLRNSQPEPDLSIVPVSEIEKRDAHPGRAILVIEIAVTSLEADREKAKIYATNGIPEYWIVNLTEGCIEAYTEPQEGAYAKRADVRTGRLRSVALPGMEVSVATVLV